MNWDYDDLLAMRLKYLMEARKWEKYESRNAAMLRPLASVHRSMQSDDFSPALSVADGRQN